jgi:hypothetical protein
MSDVAAAPSSPSPWDIEFNRLRARFPGAKPAVLFCVHAFQQRPDINIADLKAQAELHGLKVSVGSWTAARHLLSPPAARAVPAPLPLPATPPREETTATVRPEPLVLRSSEVAAADPVPAAVPAVQTNPPANARHKVITVDDAEGPVERMARLVVAQVQAAGDAKAERLREAVRQALAIIAAALEGPSAPE